MAKIATLGSAKMNASDKTLKGADRYHDLENIDVMGNGPKMKKIYLYAGLAVLAYLVYKNKNLA